MERLKSAVRKYLGKKVNAAVLYYYLSAVDKGLKPAYLYDVGTVSIPGVLKLLSDLKEQRLIINNFNVIELGTDCLIVNVEEIKKSSKRFLADHVHNCFINVSHAVGKPEVGIELSALNEMKKTLEETLTELDGSQIKHCVMTVSDSSNVSSLFGVLLDYPLVYWYDVSEGNCSDTCLNMVDLTVVSVRTTLECCVVQDDAKEVRQSFDKQVLYQFSYPSALKGHCEQVVVRWKEKLADKLRCSSDVKQFEFESQNVCMESVVL